MSSRPATSNHHESSASLSAAPGSKGVPQSMQLPNVPKMTDERNRSKYVAEYDRYEQELRKHHLGPAESTTTAGLKDLPSAFNRRVPGLNEPTAAEKEYEHMQQVLNARKKKEQRMYNITGTKRSASAGVKASADKRRSVATVPAMSSKSSISLSPGASASSPNSYNAVTASAVTAAAPQTAAAAAAAVGSAPPADAIAAAAPAAAGGAASTARASVLMPASRQTTAGLNASAPSHTRGQRGSQKAKPADSAASATASRAVPGMSTITAADSDAGKSTTTTTATGRDRGVKDGLGRTGAKPSVTVSSPKHTRAPAPTRSGASPAGHARSAPPTPTPAPSAPQPSQTTLSAPAAKLRSARALEAALEANVPTTALRTNVSAHPDASKASPAPQSGRTRTDIDDCADLVRVLVMPPEAFSESVQLDTRQFDLDWVSGFRMRPPHLITLHNFLSPPSLGAGPSGSTSSASRRINSPRSALVCLRNGISPADLVRSESGLGDEVGALPTDAALREAVMRFRTERDAARRQQLMSVVLDDYLTLCGRVPQAELIQAVQNPPESHVAVEIPTSLLQRRERQRRVFEINKVRMERQLTMEQAQYERQLAAEARKEQAEQEANAALQAKAKAEAEARAQQQARLDAQKAKNREMEAFYQRQLDEKLAKAEEKNQHRIEAQRRLFETRHDERVRKEAERRERFERNAELQAKLAAEVEARRLAKAAQLEAIQEERDARVAQERRELAEKQARAAEARDVAKRRAELEEEQVRQAALQRQAEADERLAAFQERRQEEIAARSAEEQLKAQRREQVYVEARDKERVFKEQTQARQLAHDAHFTEVQQQRALEMAIRREQEREEMTAKAFAVLKKQRMDEYSKLRTVADLVEKRKAADFVAEQRDAIQEAMLREREQLNSERDGLRAQFGNVTNR